MELNQITPSFFQEQLEIFNTTDGENHYYKITESFTPCPNNPPHNYSYNLPLCNLLAILDSVMSCIVDTYK